MPSGTADPAILLVEDKDSLRVMLRHALEGQGHVVIEARDQNEAVQALRSSRSGVVLSDLRLPEGDGSGVLRAAKELDPEMPVIVMTAFGSIQDAVAAMKEGPRDFLAKPIDPDQLLLLVERELALRRMVTENILLKEELASRRPIDRRGGCEAQARDRGAAAGGHLGCHGAPRRGDCRLAGKWRFWVSHLFALRVAAANKKSKRGP